MKVYIVFYAYYDHIEIMEVFSSRQLAMEYLESPVITDKIERDYYKPDRFDILVKYLWSE